MKLIRGERMGDSIGDILMANFYDKNKNMSALILDDISYC